jgi:hypothetical protein
VASAAYLLGRLLRPLQAHYHCRFVSLSELGAQLLPVDAELLSDSNLISIKFASSRSRGSMDPEG